MESAMHSDECKNNPAPEPKQFIMASPSKHTSKGISEVLDENWCSLVYFNQL